MAMLDWNNYRQQLTVRIGEVAKLSPDTIKRYQALTAAGQKTNLLGPKIRELISLAVAVTVRCDGVSQCTPKRRRGIAGRLRAGDCCAMILRRWRRRMRACDLDHAPGPRVYREAEAVQLYNRGHEVKAKTQA